MKLFHVGIAAVAALLLMIWVLKHSFLIVPVFPIFVVLAVVFVILMLLFAHIRRL